jgi:hypothetical protein
VRAHCFSFKKHTTEMTSVAAMTCHWLRALNLPDRAVGE